LIVTPNNDVAVHSSLENFVNCDSKGTIKTPPPTPLIDPIVVDIPPIMGTINLSFWLKS